MKQHIIYNNYDLWEDYADDCKAFLQEERPDEEITESSIWEEIYFQSNLNWEEEHAQLSEFFTNHEHFMLRGIVQRWNGSSAGAYIFDNFDDMFYKAVESCDYFKIWDENGHLYIKCSHHDGTNIFEIKRITDKAYNFISNWNYDWSDTRSEEEIHNVVWNSNFLSSLPHYFKNVYGGVKR